MPIRFAKPADEPTMASIMRTAFFEEALFGSVIHPHRHEYPDDVKIFWSQSLRQHWKTPSDRILVATTTVDGEEKIAGVAVWQRQGDDEGAKKVQSEWTDIGTDPFQPLPNTSNRALDPSKRTVLEESFPHCAHLWSGARKNNWYLVLCGVHPDYAGQGLGYQLVRWGLDRAEQENVHASVVASYQNDGFYLRCGYDEVVGSATAGEGNPLMGVKGGNVLFMFPKEMP